jgi:penicillin-binding protein 1B
MQRLDLRDPASQQGLRVFSTLDPLIQARAQALVAASVSTYEKQYRHLRPLPGGEIQGALVALRPADGAVLAMIGGRDYTKSQFNRVTQAHRQPGSLFKPFVYLAGFQKSFDQHEAVFTAATVLDDSPLEMEVNGELWTPHNFDEEYRGPVTAREALARSLNIPTIRAAELIGLRDVVRMARRCGITSPLQAVPSIALGTFEVSPLEIAAAFTPIASLGTRVDPYVITAIVDDSGEVRRVDPPAPQSVISPEAAYMTLDLMRDVVRYGTGAGIWGYGVEGEFAGKTGTTDEGRDNWFVGFSPDYLGLAWVGFDNNRPLKLGGSVLALPIWAQLAARSGLDTRRGWTAPPGIVEEEVDPATGLLASWRCPDSTEEIFIGDAVPAPCEDHGSGFSNWAREVIDWFRRD